MSEICDLKIKANLLEINNLIFGLLSKSKSEINIT